MNASSIPLMEDVIIVATESFNLAKPVMMIILALQMDAAKVALFNKAIFVPEPPQNAKQSKRFQ